MVNGGRLTEGMGVRVSVFNRKVRGGRKGLILLIDCGNQNIDLT